jgi:hypothetical protein
VLTTPIYMTHVFTTMQTAAIVRCVFIKTTKKFEKTHEYKRDLNELITDLKHVFWESEHPLDEVD